MKHALVENQRRICEKFSAPYCPPLPLSKIGIAENFDGTDLPVNGLRHPQAVDTSGWYLWRGQSLSQADDFFKPMHIEHIIDEHPDVAAYLALPPGWRFLLAGDHVDVWQDNSLLEI